MGKFIVILVASVAIVWGMRLFFPGMANVALHINSWGVTYTVLCFLAAFVLCFKLVD